MKHIEVIENSKETSRLIGEAYYKPLTHFFLNFIVKVYVHTYPI